jgi:hypothetical protein
MHSRYKQGGMEKSTLNTRAIKSENPPEQEVKIVYNNSRLPDEKAHKKFRTITI